MKKILFKIWCNITSCVSSLKPSRKIMMMILTLTACNIGYQTYTDNISGALQGLNNFVIFIIIFAFSIAYDMLT